ncbi:hypothetical protein GOEFS_106_00170 [Gordonia effusa NBRC 100432]|uniref:HTH cro/C1-type domain-containing protein n=1 Tax=Gordonia effusa NBRC 100432 TaxID=1077974 RepID=H0R4X0_9ACTN|nr:helix-turn-helix transcriptional regulator [Gordonia effusa]GAB20121.1 hypothetical protein GOEFS_106_00170 [Gordonia effusa NBRC 100432]
MSSSTLRSHPTFACLLAELFDNTFRYDGSPVTATEIARRIAPNRRAVKESYLSQLRNGIANEPSLKAVSALADAFDVDIAYFTVRFQMQHADISPAERVSRARVVHNVECYRLASAIADLPLAQRNVVVSLIQILHEHNRPARISA